MALGWIPTPRKTRPVSKLPRSTNTTIGRLAGVLRRRHRRASAALFQHHRDVIGVGCAITTSPASASASASITSRLARFVGMSTRSSRISASTGGLQGVSEVCYYCTLSATARVVLHSRYLRSHPWGPVVVLCGRRADSRIVP